MQSHTGIFECVCVCSARLTVRMSISTKLTTSLIVGSEFSSIVTLRASDATQLEHSRYDHQKLHFHPPIFMCILEYRLKKHSGKGKMRIKNVSGKKKCA